MSFHTVGFAFKDSPTLHFPGGFSPLPALADSFFSLATPAPGGVTNSFLLPVDMKLVMAFAISPSLDSARINAPSLRRVTLPLIRPIERGTTPPGDPNVMWGHVAETTIPLGEPVGVDAAVNAANEPSIFAFLWFVHKEPRPIPHGDAFWVSYSSTVPGETASTVPFQWFPVPIAFDEVLPSGTYAVIGLEHHSPTSIAARLVFPGSPFRPGTVATGDVNLRTSDRFYDGSLGTMGIFRTTSEPTIEVCASGTDDMSEHRGQMRLIRVGGLGADFHPHRLHRLDEHAPDKPGSTPEHQGAASPTLPHELAAMLTGHKEPGM